MIWHIMRKDLRLLWPMAAVLAAVEWLNAVLLGFGAPFARDSLVDLGVVPNLVLPAISLIGLIVLAVILVQQDRFSGTTQDWLTRPVPRGALIAAKISFVVLIGLGPILMADIFMGLAEHLPVFDVLAASCRRGFVLFGLVCLPALMLGAVTRSLPNALVFVFAITVILVMEVIVFAAGGIGAPVVASGYAWTISLVLIVMNLAMTSALLPLQLRWRDTNRARWMLAAYLCAAPAVVLLPMWAAAKIQGTLARAADPGMSLAIDITRQVSFSPPNEPLPGLPGRRAPFVRVTVPVNHSGGPMDLWRLDYLSARAVSPETNERLNTLTAIDASAWLSGDVSNTQLVFNVPTEVFDRARRRHARIQLTAYVTTFRRVAQKTIGSLDGASIDGSSLCRKRRSGWAESIQCVSTRPVGVCMNISDPNHMINLDWARVANVIPCGRAYAPWPLPFWRDPYYVLDMVGQAWFSNAPEGSTPEGVRPDRRIVSNFLPSAHLRFGLEFELDAATAETTNRMPKTVDGVGSAARFGRPSGMAIDSHGNLFIVEDDVIRKVTPAGEVTTFAGHLGEAWSIDGRGTDARFKGPIDIAVDAADNLYVTESGASVRKITPNGVVATLARADENLPDSDAVGLRWPRAVAAADGTVYVLDQNKDGAHVLLKISPTGGVSKLAGP
jgi:hypothetical protein